MKVSENGLLAALLKNTYGGDGVNTFGLPDLRCRVPIGAGQGPGLQNFEVGKPGGEFVHTLSQAEMPQHRHAIMAIDSEAKEAKPASQVPAAAEMYAAAPKPADASPMGSSFLEERGGVEQHENTMPYVVLRYVISANGVMPPR
jgi:microcystin-dependent protein